MTAFTHNKRRTMTAQRVARIYELRNGRCGVIREDGTYGDGCGIEIGFKPYEVDHIIALANGGTDLDDNLQILCRYCHAAKTKEDISKTAKIKRSFSNHRVPSKYKRSRAWR